MVTSPELAKHNLYLLTPTSSTNTNDGAVTTPTDLFFERPETPEGEKLDLRQLSLALTRLLYPKV
jgi:hypothetical protein